MDSSDSNKLKRWNGSSWEIISDTRIASAITQIADTKQLADTKIRTFAQPNAPTGLTSVDTGDLWADTDDSNKLYRWNGTKWVPLDDKRIASLSSEVQTLKNTVATQTTTYLTNIAPTSPRSGDLWFDSGNGNQLKRWNGTSWVSIDDADLTKAIADITQVQGQVDSKVRTFAQTDAPTGLLAKDVGDLWIDTDDSNKLHRWNGSSWVDVHDKTMDTLSNLINTKINTYYSATAPTNKVVGDLWIDTSAGNTLKRWSGSAWTVVTDSKVQAALTAAGDAKAIADGKIRTFAQVNAPTGLVASDVGDLWIDTDDKNKMYRWSGTDWVLVDDQRISDLSSSLVSLQNTVASQTSTYMQSTAPAGKVGDLWFDTSSGNQLKRWDGSAWVSIDDAELSKAISDITQVQSQVDSKVRTFAQIDAPTGLLAKDVGDLWIDTDDKNKMYRWNGTNWIDVHDTNIDAVRALASGKSTTYYQPTAPSNKFIGDLWIDTDDGNKLSRWNGTSWVTITDARVQEALVLAGDAQATADSKINTYAQTDAPTGLVASDVGDLWIDTDDSNKLYRWSGTSWVAIDDLRIGLLDSAVKTAQQTADLAVSSANGKNKVYRSTSGASGTATNVGDIWYRFTDNTYTKVAQQWTWDGSKWVEAKLEHSTISSIDVGSLTVAGQSTLASVVASRIFTDIFTANKITAKELNIASGSLFPDPLFQANGGYPGWEVVNGGLERVSTGVKYDAPFPHLDIAVAGGESYIIQAQKNTISGDEGGSIFFWGMFLDSSGKQISAKTILNLSSEGESTGTFTVPNNTVKLRYLIVFSEKVPVGTRLRLSNVRIVRQSEAVMIKDGAITADKIAANSITANKLLISSNDNLLVNGSFEAYNSNTMKPLSWTAPHSTSKISTTVRRLSGVSLETNVTGQQQVAYSENIPVEEDSYYRMSCWYMVQSGNTTGSVEMRVRHADSRINTSSIINVPATQNTGTWQRMSKEVYIPVGQKEVQLNLVQRDITDGMSVWYDDVSFVRASDGKLIVDGSIDGKTITGALVQTSSTLNRGIKLSPTGLDAYSTTGSKVFSVDTLGNATFTGTVNITGGSVPVGNLTSGTIASGQAIKSASGTARVELSTAGLKAYNSSGSNTVSINTDGSASFTGVITAVGGSSIDGSYLVDGSISEGKVIGLSDIKTIANNAKLTADASKVLTDNWVFSGSTTIDGGKIQADTIRATHIAADAITSKHVITGAVFQTSPTAKTGIKIDSSALIAYSPSGSQTVNLNASTGELRIASGFISNSTITGSMFQTSANASTGIKFDNLSLRAYASDQKESFKLDATTGQVNMTGGLFTGGTVTGATIQTSAIPNRGLKITSTGLTAYNTAGSPTVQINSDGSASFTGVINATGASSIDGSAIIDGTIPDIKIPLLSSWKMTNTTTIDGGKIATNTVTADQIAARSIKAHHMDFVSEDPLSGGSMSLDSSGLILRRDGSTIFQLTNKSVETVSLTNTSGDQVVTLDNEGGVSGQHGTFDELTVDGIELKDYLSALPLGVIARSRRDNNPANTQYSKTNDHEQPVMRVEFDYRAGYTYRISATGLQVYIPVNDMATRARFMLRLRTDTTTLGVADLSTWLVSHSTTGFRSAGDSSSSTTSVEFLWSPNTSGTASALLSYKRLGGPASTEGVRIAPSTYNPFELTVWEEALIPVSGKSDFLGSISPPSSGTTGPVDTTPAPRRVTQTWTASSTTAWWNSLTYNSPNYPGKHMWQGVWSGDPNGVKKSHAIFSGAGDKGNTLAQARSKMTSLEKLEVYLYNGFFYSSSGGTARLHYHKGTSSTSYPALTHIGDYKFKRGEGKWIEIKSQAAKDAFMSGAFTGIALDPRGSKSHEYYGYFRGIDGGNRVPKIRATYLTT